MALFENKTEDKINGVADNLTKFSIDLAAFFAKVIAFLQKFLGLANDWNVTNDDDIDYGFEKKVD